MFARLSEWSNESVCKTELLKQHAGSNPAPSFMESKTSYLDSCIKCDKNVTCILVTAKGKHLVICENCGNRYTKTTPFLRGAKKFEAKRKGWS